MIDKSKELNTSIVLVNDRLNFEGIVGDNSPVWSMIRGNVEISIKHVIFSEN